MISSIVKQKQQKEWKENMGINPPIQKMFKETIEHRNTLENYKNIVQIIYQSISMRRIQESSKD